MAPKAKAAASPDLEKTHELLALVREGDATARERLLRRYLPILTRWASGRLPGYARSLADTDDLVQTTLIRALNHLDHFEPQREGALLTYLRHALLNAIRDEIRSVRRRPIQESLDVEIVDPGRSVVDRAIERETREWYEAGLAELTEEQREAVILRFEFGFTLPQIAAAMGKPSSDAPRMLIARALVRLAKAMHEPES